MKPFSALVSFRFFATILPAQCPDFELASFQTLQRADSGVREARILELGFDPFSEFVLKSGGGTFRRYNKCWMGNAGATPIYQQILLWNTTTSQLMLLLKNEEDFRRFRSSIEDRSSSANARKGADFYVGQQFIYHFGLHKIDNQEYYSTSISFKS
jgi:hypothetical protein